MNKLDIVFLDAFTNNPGDLSFDALYSVGNCAIYDRTSIEEVMERASEAEVLIVNKFKVGQALLDKMPKLKYIVVSATGFNNIDIAAVKSRGIPVSNVRGYSVSSVAQHVFASCFAILNRIEHYDKAVKQGRWSSCPDFCFYDHTITELAGKKMGIIGFGAIGKKVAQISTSFDMKVLVYTRTIPHERYENIEFVPLESIFTESDILTLHCPLNAQTEEIINKDSLKKMKPNAIVVNTGRGQLINESDLIYALDHSIIAGVALDVLSQEPPSFSNPILHHPKAIVTPHIAWTSLEARKQLMVGVVNNIQSFINGEIINSIY